VIKRLALSGVFAVLLAFPIISAADDVLYLPESIQEHSQWCWAGSSQAVLQHYGAYVEQCEIVNWAFGSSSCCGNTDFYWTDTSCNNWNYMYGVTGSLQDILTHWGVNSSSMATYLSKSSCVSEIDAGRPFVMRFGWTSGGGHFLVGYGYVQSGDYLDYMDPWLGNGYTKSLYDWIVGATDHTWTHTLQITTNPASTCAVDPIMIGSTYYPSVNNAYMAATSGQTIKMKEQIFTEAPMLSRDISVTLKGGYDCSYSSNTGLTSIGALTVSGGTVTVENVLIR